jgi:hypothetical protein
MKLMALALSIAVLLSQARIVQAQQNCGHINYYDPDFTDNNMNCGADGVISATRAYSVNCTKPDNTCTWVPLFRL